MHNLLLSAGELYFNTDSPLLLLLMMITFASSLFFLTCHGHKIKHIGTEMVRQPVNHRILVEFLRLVIKLFRHSCHISVSVHELSQ